jgi:predicted nuclease of predicted toxin-antitoxin system
MRFLANENFPGAAVEAMRGAGHDVAWVRTEAPGSTEESVLAWAVQEGRILLTFDKDFGELAWRARLPSQCGIVLFRLFLLPPDRVGVVLCRILCSRDDWAGKFSVIETGRVRMRDLPG